MGLAVSNIHFSTASDTWLHPKMRRSPDLKTIALYEKRWMMGVKCALVLRIQHCMNDLWVVRGGASYHQSCKVLRRIWSPINEISHQRILMCCSCNHLIKSPSHLYPGPPEYSVQIIDLLSKVLCFSSRQVVWYGEWMEHSSGIWSNSSIATSRTDRTSTHHDTWYLHTLGLCRAWCSWKGNHQDENQSSTYLSSSTGDLFTENG